ISRVFAISCLTVAPTNAKTCARASAGLENAALLTFRSGDAQLAYEVRGDGPPVVLLHPFPLHHEFWNGAAQQLSSRYRLILPDLRAHGDSELGNGAATMQKLADDLARLLRDERISRAFFVGVSIGGYLLFEFW